MAHKSVGRKMDSISVEEALGMRKDICFVDVRSLEEYKEASIPGAVCIPLFDEKERRELGLTYKNEGIAAARLLGLEMAAPKLPRLYLQVMEAAKDKKPVLYCWRGGMRSESLMVILRLMRMPARQLAGGYKAFRRFINRSLAAYDLKPELVVLHGLTGVGKTKIINDLKNRGYPAIDLEGLACHRGSVFGGLGKKGSRSQKDFESLLWLELEEYKESPYILVEGEGKKIGPVYLPPFFAAAMEKGHHILLKASFETRVDRICEEYIKDCPLIREEGRAALDYLGSRMGAKKVGELQALLQGNRVREVVRILCRDYYDFLYGDSRLEKNLYEAVIDVEELARGTDELAAYLDNLADGRLPEVKAADSEKKRDLEQEE
ncbi:MAG TPA: tRNA 2-selenouridine(34) synthase MnmH [Firmicutes bacterium]|nr:tRNA 2-selenouridine(34) synthase MnmH [Bacillota bacterium]